MGNPMTALVRDDPGSREPRADRSGEGGRLPSWDLGASPSTTRARGPGETTRYRGPCHVRGPRRRSGGRPRGPGLGPAGSGREVLELPGARDSARQYLVVPQNRFDAGAEPVLLLAVAREQDVDEDESLVDGPVLEGPVLALDPAHRLRGEGRGREDGVVPDPRRMGAPVLQRYVFDGSKCLFRPAPCRVGKRRRQLVSSPPLVGKGRGGSSSCVPVRRLSGGAEIRAALPCGDDLT